MKTKTLLFIFILVTFPLSDVLATGSGLAAANEFSASTEISGEQFVIKSNEVSVYDINKLRPFTSSSTKLYEKAITTFNNQLYFTSFDSSLNKSLWMYDNKTEKSYRVFTDEAEDEVEIEYIAYDEQFYFSADNSVNGRELWRYNSASHESSLVADIYTGSRSSTPEHFVATADSFYFVADDGIHGRELWEYDNQTKSAILASDINKGSLGSIKSKLLKSDNYLYFIANDGTTGDFLWRYDLQTKESTKVVNQSSIEPEELKVNEFKVSGKHLYYSVSSEDNSIAELWHLDESSEETTLVTSDVNSRLISKDNKLYFNKLNGQLAYEIWEYDATNKKGVVLNDFQSKIQLTDKSDYPLSLVIYNEKLFFSHPSLSKLWEYDIQNRNISVAFEYSEITWVDSEPFSNGLTDFYIHFNKLYFNLAYFDSGAEDYESTIVEFDDVSNMVTKLYGGGTRYSASLIVSDENNLYHPRFESFGKQTGIVHRYNNVDMLLSLFNLESGADSNPKNFTEYDGKLYLSAFSELKTHPDTEDPIESLWVYNQETGNIEFVADFEDDSTDEFSTYSLKDFTVYQDKLFFIVSRSNGQELWVFDQNNSSSIKLVNIPFKNVGNLLFHKNTLYLEATNYENKKSIEGLNLTTLELKKIIQIPEGEEVFNFVIYNESLYFIAGYWSYTNLKLHQYRFDDSSSDIISELGDYAYANYPTNPPTLKVFDDELFFITGSNLKGNQNSLRKYNDRTNTVSNIMSVGEGTLVSPLVNYQNKLYFFYDQRFALDDNKHTYQLWYYDPTRGQANIVEDDLIHVCVGQDLSSRCHFPAYASVVHGGYHENSILPVITNGALYFKLANVVYKLDHEKEVLKALFSLTNDIGLRNNTQFFGYDNEFWLTGDIQINENYLGKELLKVLLLDTDNDGTDDNIDMDDDNDGVNDEEDAFPLDANESIDTDGDGIGNNADTDDDDDGVNDEYDAFPLDATKSVSAEQQSANDSGGGGSSSIFLFLLFVSIILKRVSKINNSLLE